MAQLVFRTFVHKGGYFFGPRKTEVPTYLQSHASALVTDIDNLLFTHDVSPIRSGPR